MHMSHRRTMFFESTCTILGCKPGDFWSIYENDKVATDVLSDDILTNVIGTNYERLRVADRRCHLDDLLSAMIIRAPHPLGQRYVAISLHIKGRRRGNQSGERMDGASVPRVSASNISLSSFTLDHSVLAISRIIKTEPSGSQTPEPEASDFKKKVSINNSSFFLFFALIQQGGLIACYSRGILLRNLPRIRQRSCGSTYNARSSGRYSQGQRVFYNWTHPHHPFLAQ